MSASSDMLWQTSRQSDFTEGRGSMIPTGEFYLTEQDAWDAVNDLGGVQGSHPTRFMGGRTPAGNWQEYKAAGGHPDWDVIPVPRINPMFERAAVKLGLDAGSHRKSVESAFAVADRLNAAGFAGRANGIISAATFLSRTVDGAAQIDAAAASLAALLEAAAPLLAS